MRRVCSRDVSGDAVRHLRAILAVLAPTNPPAPKGSICISFNCASRSLNIPSFWTEIARLKADPSRLRLCSVRRPYGNYSCTVHNLFRGSAQATDIPLVLAVSAGKRRGYATVYRAAVSISLICFRIAAPERCASTAVRSASHLVQVWCLRCGGRQAHAGHHQLGILSRRQRTGTNKGTIVRTGATRQLAASALKSFLASLRLNK